ncbi:NAD-dependent epimerase/dehydratase family protein [Nakamurella lactea]|uniref:NAD-dependent epimerase/dehydratase family protein n=1 Tax=Nakamurella lactea TaxID=459515 RepID=UPI00048AAB12|nr:NAD(P)-dependent oxidoreductase [Nakamurella lactea]
MTPTPAVRSWVIGSGGLLGSALQRSLTAGGDTVIDAGSIPWNRPVQARAQLAATTRRLLAASGRSGDRWRIAWCAGAGVTGTTDAELADEIGALRTVLDTVAEQIAGGAVDPLAGSVFVASSAGGVYAGSAGPPFTEQHEARPTSGYGRAKLAGEQLAQAFAAGTGVPTVIGRITNLYGPGQNLAKPQGLISHLCRTQLARTSISIYVSLDTIRDYLYVDDCADMVRLALAGVVDVTTDGSRCVVKIFGAHQGVTIGALLGEFRRVFKRAPLVVLGTSATAKFQAGDLRVRSTVWPELDHRALTSLPSGLAATAEDLFRSVRVAG